MVRSTFCAPRPGEVLILTVHQELTLRLIVPGGVSAAAAVRGEPACLRDATPVLEPARRSTVVSVGTRGAVRLMRRAREVRPTDAKVGSSKHVRGRDSCGRRPTVPRPALVLLLHHLLPRGEHLLERSRGAHQPRLERVNHGDGVIPALLRLLRARRERLELGERAVQRGDVLLDDRGEFGDVPRRIVEGSAPLGELRQALQLLRRGVDPAADPRGHSRKLAGGARRRRGAAPSIPDDESRPRRRRWMTRPRIWPRARRRRRTLWSCPGPSPGGSPSTSSRSPR